MLLFVIKLPTYLFIRAAENLINVRKGIYYLLFSTWIEILVLANILMLLNKLYLADRIEVSVSNGTCGLQFYRPLSAKSYSAFCSSSIAKNSPTDSVVFHCKNI